MLFTAAYTQYTGTITWNLQPDIFPPEDPADLNNLLILNTVEEGAYTSTTYLTPTSSTTFTLSDLIVDHMYNIELSNYIATGEIDSTTDSQINLTVTEYIGADPLDDSSEEESTPMEEDDEDIGGELPSMIIDADPEDDVMPDDDDPSAEQDGDEEGDDSGGDDSIDIVDIDIPETLPEDEITSLKQQAVDEICALLDEWKLKGIDITYNEEVIDQDLIGTYTELVPGPNMTIDTEIDNEQDLDGKTVEELQSDIQIDVTQQIINGTLKYVKGYTGYSQDEEKQEGYFLALHLNTTTETFNNPVIRVELDETKEVTREGVVVIRIDRELAEVDRRYINVSLVQKETDNEIYWLQTPLLVNVVFEEPQEI